LLQEAARPDRDFNRHFSIFNVRIRQADTHSTALLRRAANSLQPPANLFSGLNWSHAMAPDHIVFFKRTDVSAFKPEGVSNNYHHRFELVVVLEKAGPIRIGDANFLLHPGEAALIFPNQFHHYMDVEQGRLEWLFITFELKNSDEIASLKGRPKVLDPSDLHLLALIVMEYVHPSRGVPDAVEISHHLSQLLRAMVGARDIPDGRRSIRVAENPRDLLLEKINRYVRRHLKEAPTIGDLAEALGYSVSHMRAVFRTQLGISLGRYIRESRLSHAASLLQSTKTTISEVAEKSGFASISAFSRAFKRAYGLAPNAYGKLVR
jgi:AraC-like DNA-binding protein